MQIHRPLTFEERRYIEFRLRLKCSLREIGRKLGRDHSIIIREVASGGGRKRYTAATSEKRAARARTKRGRHRKLEDDIILHETVVRELKGGLAPHVIAGRLKTHPPGEDNPLFGKTISHEAIYQYIYEGEGRWEGLYSHLRYKHRKRRKHHSRKPRKNTIPERISIHERPLAVALRTTLGHWESDSVIYQKQKAILSVQVERKSRLLRFHRAVNKTAEETEQAWRKTIESLPKELFKTMTFDNGTEGARHLILRSEFQIDTYHCDAFASWQKGGVENANGIIRRFLPKQKDLSALTDREIYEIQERINNTPRKSLNYSTPNEVIAQYLSSGALIS